MSQRHTTLCCSVFKVEKREEVLQKINSVSPLCRRRRLLLYLTLSPVTCLSIRLCFPIFLSVTLFACYISMRP